MTELVTAGEPAVAERFDGFRHAVSDTFVPLTTTTDECGDADIRRRGCGGRPAQLRAEGNSAAPGSQARPAG